MRTAGRQETGLNRRVVAGRRGEGRLPWGRGQRGSQDGLRVVSMCNGGFTFQTSDHSARDSLSPTTSIRHGIGLDPPCTRGGERAFKNAGLRTGFRTIPLDPPRAAQGWMSEAKATRSQNSPFFPDLAAPCRHPPPEALLELPSAGRTAPGPEHLLPRPQPGGAWPAGSPAPGLTAAACLPPTPPPVTSSHSARLPRPRGPGPCPSHQEFMASH